jgi:protein disulfide-isomerase
MMRMFFGIIVSTLQNKGGTIMKTIAERIVALSVALAALGAVAAADCSSCKAKKMSSVAVKSAPCVAQLWTEDIDGAFKTAAAEGKSVFIDFTGSDWCYWCILADKNIFSTSEWEKFSRKMVCLKVDFPKNNRPDAATQLKRKAFAREFNVRGYPTFVLASPERKEIARFSAGRKSAAAFIAEVEKALPR